MKRVRPIFHSSLDDIIRGFYYHILSFPEGRKILSDPDVIARLPERQKSHWITLFSCKFDDIYAKNAINIGKVHFKNKVSPYVYISGYNYFQCELIKAVSAECRGDADLAAMLMSIAKVISLDMDLALSAYTREYWHRRDVEMIDA